MALHEYEVDGLTFLFDEEDPLLPKNAKRVSDEERLAEVPESPEESTQPEDAPVSDVPADADPAPVAESHVKRGRRVANKQADAPADKS